jgi:hypothetical protein
VKGPGGLHHRALAATLLRATPAQAAPGAPVVREVITGGNSIAVLWRPGSGAASSYYTLYRDNTVLATNLTVQVNGIQADGSAGVTTQRYIDTTNLVAGQTYTYKVTATATDGSVYAPSPTT